MDRRDLMTIVIALIIVAALALYAPFPEKGPEGFAMPEIPSGEPCPTEPAGIPVPSQSIPSPAPVTVRQFGYAADSLQYPVHMIPENMNIYGASDPEWPDTDWIPFAYLTSNHGGLSESFTIGSPVWKVACTIQAEHHPASAGLRWILVERETGSIVEGAEVLNRGTVTKTVQISGTPMYFIISARDVDTFNLTLETPAGYAGSGCTDGIVFKRE